MKKKLFLILGTTVIIFGIVISQLYGVFQADGNDARTHISTNTLDISLISDGVNQVEIFKDLVPNQVVNKEMAVTNVQVEKHIELGDFDKNDAPTFMFKLTDSKGLEHFKTISFGEGENDKSVIFKDIPYGYFTVEEIDSIRYEVDGKIIKKGVLNADTVDENNNLIIKFVNKKMKNNDFSDTNLVINSFKKGNNGIEISKNEHNNGKGR